MSVSSKLTALDKLVQKGDFINAVNQYFADNVVSHYGQADVVEGKEGKIRGLEYFMNAVDNVKEITLHDKATKGAETFSLYTFEFTQKGGNNLAWYEVIRRVWNNELVVEEEYLVAETATAAKALFTEVAPKKATRKTTAKKATTKKVAAKKPAAKKATAKKDSAVKTTKAATKKVTAKTTTAKKAVAKKADDLKKIEGVGPKIAQLLTDGGFPTFAKVAKAKPAALKTILDNAGSRYRMHNPTTWPAQAKLAAAGKWAELKKWQDELKGGKKA
ncbi:MAG: helix-hairpin-helix domain-containing protein [Saprospiraceae bacterium]